MTHTTAPDRPDGQRPTRDVFALVARGVQVGSSSSRHGLPVPVLPAQIPSALRQTCFHRKQRGQRGQLHALPTHAIPGALVTAHCLQTASAHRHGNCLCVIRTQCRGRRRGPQFGEIPEITGHCFPTSLRRRRATDEEPAALEAVSLRWLPRPRHATWLLTSKKIPAFLIRFQCLPHDHMNSQ